MTISIHGMTDQYIADELDKGKCPICWHFLDSHSDGCPASKELRQDFLNQTCQHEDPFGGPCLRSQGHALPHDDGRRGW